MRKLVLSAVFAGAAISVAPVALATTSASYSFTQCLAGCTGSVSSIATLSLSEIANGVAFELTDAGPGSSFIGGLYFNGVSGSVEWNVDFQSYKGFSYSTTAKPTATSANGYNWDFTFPTAAHKDRFVNGDTAKWTITGNGVDLTDFTGSAKMMIHLQNVPALSGGSEKVAAVLVVPEPESYAMLLAGLGLMGVIARRRNWKKAARGG